MTQRLNVGCGGYPLPGWHNLDVVGLPSVIANAVPLPFQTGVLDEIFACHFLEHLTQIEANTFLTECHRCLPSGGKLGIVVPDFPEIMRRYLDPNSNARFEMPPGTWHDLHDLDSVCHIMLFSTIQSSHHRWAYDKGNLSRLMYQHGFRSFEVINRWMDPRITVGAWYQFGIQGIKE